MGGLQSKLPQRTQFVGVLKSFHRVDVIGPIATCSAKVVGGKPVPDEYAAY
jgi:hypothetical protein